HSSWNRHCIRGGRSKKQSPGGAGKFAFSVTYSGSNDKRGNSVCTARPVRNYARAPGSYSMRANGGFLLGKGLFYRRADFFIRIVRRELLERGLQLGQGRSPAAE